MEETTTSGSVHELLLRLAGRVDDDLMAQVRELVAVREDGRALELLAAAIAADATVLPADIRGWLVRATRAVRTDLDADGALAPAGDTGDEHRFTAEAPPGSDGVVAAVRALPARWLEGCDVRLTWRLTPAGTAPGPLPHPVLLVRTAADGSGPDDVIAYQLASALNRSVAPVSVEVVAADHVPSAYHAAAWLAALAVRASGGADGVDGGDGGYGGDGDGGASPDMTETRHVAGPLGGPTNTASGTPRTDDPRSPGSHRLWVPSQTDGTTAGRPLTVRNGRSGFDGSDATEIAVPEQPATSAVGAVAPGTADGAARSVFDTESIPDPGPDADPHHTPPPLPMRAPGGRRRLVEESGPQRPAAPRLPRSPQPSPVPFARRSRPSPRPQPAPPSAVVDPEQGTIPRPNRPDPLEWVPVATGGQHDPLLGPVRRPLLDPLLDPTFPEDTAGHERGRPAGVDAPGAGPSREPASSPGSTAAPAPRPDDVAALPDMGLRPESLARLSDADRALLARLQAELMAGRGTPDTDSGGRAVTNGTAARPDPSDGA